MFVCHAERSICHACFTAAQVLDPIFKSTALSLRAHGARWRMKKTYPVMTNQQPTNFANCLEMCARSLGPLLPR